ncbi:hypothetical protein F3Y22_tig00013285pilonHSYRG00213 [Hibiscus syriacus]|uniref:Uncharacterized protein n=1 Tax=Hibiscus syriacus TaxID=106335 RepID=A0A6A3C797_HIBSY|nr:hypothetical protein F3Y22_tig00013285pilonHSYRG00213 [Hibiscus syriacus]
MEIKFEGDESHEQGDQTARLLQNFTLAKVPEAERKLIQQAISQNVSKHSTWLTYCPTGPSSLSNSSRRSSPTRRLRLRGAVNDGGPRVLLSAMVFAAVALFDEKVVSALPVTVESGSGDPHGIACWDWGLGVCCLLFFRLLAMELGSLVRELVILPSLPFPLNGKFSLRNSPYTSPLLNG